MNKKSAIDLLMLLVFAALAGSALRQLESENWYGFAFSTMGAMACISYAAIRMVNRSHERAVTRR
jgi:hypothetical protein